MIRFVLAAAVAIVAASVSSAQVAALPPSELDSAFEVRAGATLNQCYDQIINNKQFKEAVDEAVAAYKANANRGRGVIGPSPAQSARVKFLDTINQRKLIGGVVPAAGAAPAVGALPPIKLDDAFDRNPTAKSFTDGLLNNTAFIEAVKASMKARADVQPGVVGPTPAQRAASAFLDELSK